MKYEPKSCGLEFTVTLFYSKKTERLWRLQVRTTVQLLRRGSLCQKATNNGTKLMLRIEDDVPVVAATLNLGLTSVAVGGGRYP
jgi:hypothetical protein